MIAKFGAVICDQIDKETARYEQIIAGGGCRTFEEYQKLCGVIQGLAHAKSYLLTLLEKVEKTDE